MRSTSVIDNILRYTADTSASELAIFLFRISY
jgi:hypothetical protein